MTIPHRGTTGDGTYFVTASTAQKKALLQSDRMARLFIERLIAYRDQGKYRLHEFVVMPDHFHLLLTPIVTLERAIQFVKGEFSFRAGKIYHLRSSIWQTSFYDRRVRDLSEYQAFTEYIHQSPVKGRLVNLPSDFPYSSAAGQFPLDPPPQRLKPVSGQGSQCSAKALLHP